MSTLPRPATYDAHPGLRFRTIEPRETQDPGAEVFAGWVQAMHRGFHEPRASEEAVRRWGEHVRAEGSVVRGVWPERTGVGDVRMPVATFESWEKSINVGGGRVLPLHMITAVTVAPTHRRQGLLATLMAEDLREAAARGRPLAALTVSEGGIYGRFGFGPAHRTREVELRVTGGFRMHPPAGAEVPGGRLEMAEPLDAWPAVQSVFARRLASQRGEVDRPSFYEPELTGAFDADRDAPDKKLRAVVHLDAEGEPDGYALFRHLGEQEPLTAQVTHLQALDPAVELRLCRFLAEMDLVDRLQVRRLPLDHPLDHAAVDPHTVRTTRVGDMLWLRVLDVSAALAARPWSADGSVVLGVRDALGIAEGSWRVTVRAGVASVEATDEEPGVLMDADVLGSLYLGGFRVATLAAAGRVAGDDRAVAAFAAMADGGPAPWCTTGF